MAKKAARRSKNFKKKLRKHLKRINKFEFKNEKRSAVMFGFTFLLIFCLSLIAVPRVLPVALPAQAAEPTPVPTPISPAVIIPEVPNEKRFRVSPARQLPETTELVKRRICEVFTDHCLEALVIALHESGYNINARSSANAIGVFQILCSAHKKKVGGDCNKFYDLETNLRIAHDIFARQGWGPWEARVYLREIKK